MDPKPTPSVDLSDDGPFRRPERVRASNERVDSGFDADARNAAGFTPGAARAVVVDVPNVALHFGYGGAVPPEAAGRAGVRFIRRVCAAAEATHVLLAVDAPPSFRRALSSAYKGSRTLETAAWVEALLAAAAPEGWSVAKVPGYEADDTLASAAASGARGDLGPGAVVLLVTGDSDAQSHVRPGVCVVLPAGQKVALRVLDAAAVCRRWQLPEPSKLALLKTLGGESNDGIAAPVPQLGPGRAAALLGAHGWTMEGVLEAGRQPDASTWARRAAERADAIAHAARLVNLVTTVPLPTWDACTVRAPSTFDAPAPGEATGTRPTSPPPMALQGSLF